MNDIDIESFGRHFVESETCPVKLTKSAIKQILVIISKEDESSVFYIEVESGGCFGFQYKKDVRKLKDISSDDVEVIIDEENNPIVAVHKFSKDFLKNAVIDHESDLVGKRFTIKNPNSKSSCGCGDSFSPF